MAHYLSELKDLAHRYGFRLHRIGKHYVWRNDSGAIVVTPRSGSDSYRGMKNTESQMRRASA